MQEPKPFHTGEMTFLTDLNEPDASIFFATIDDDPTAICIQYAPGDSMKHEGGMLQIRVTRDELRRTAEPSTSFVDRAATPLHLVEQGAGRRLLIEFGGDDVFISVSGSIPPARLEQVKQTIARLSSG